MNHQFHIDLVLKDPQELSVEEAKILDQHIGDCGVCRSMSDSLRSVSGVLRGMEMESPAPGFSARFEKRLQDRRHQAHSRQIVFTSILLGAGLMLVGVLLIRSALPLILSPELFFWTCVYRLLGILAYWNMFQVFFQSALTLPFVSISFIAWIFAIGLLSEVIVLWFVSYRLLTKPQRTIK